MEVVVIVALVAAVFIVGSSARRDPPSPRRPSAHRPTIIRPAYPRRFRPPSRRPSPQTGPKLETTSLLRGPAWVIDGDTIVVEKIHVRLFGIDAPELEHPFGIKAKWEMVRLCKGQIVTVELLGSDHYDRPVGICRLPDGRDLSAEMVKIGMAIDWPKFSGGVYSQFEPDGIRKKLWRCDARQKGRMPAPAPRVPQP